MDFLTMLADFNNATITHVVNEKPSVAIWMPAERYAPPRFYDQRDIFAQVATDKAYGLMGDSGGPERHCNAAHIDIGLKSVMRNIQPQGVMARACDLTTQPSPQARRQEVAKTGQVLQVTGQKVL